MHAFVGKRERAVLEYTISELITKPHPPKDYLGGWGFGLRFLALCVAIRSYCAASRALSGLYLMPFLCHSTKKGRKKGNLDVPSKTSLPPAVPTMNGGDFAFASVLHLRGIYPTPQMGLLLARIFAFPFLFEICAKSGA